MKTWIEKIAGMNWRTSLLGYLTTISLLIGAWQALPPETRSNPQVIVPAILAMLIKTLQDSQMKDKKVSGNAVEGYQVPSADVTGHMRDIPPDKPPSSV